MTDLTKGFALNSPALFVPWDVTDQGLTTLFAGLSIKRVTRGYYVIECEPFAGLLCSLGFHLHGTLDELEFFRSSYIDQRKSYEEFQSHLETAFGDPTHTGSGSEGFPSHTWLMPGARIIHHVIDRFGPEEHVRIIRA